MVDPFRDVARRAAGQFGLVERQWLLANGITQSRIQRWLDRGRLEVVQRRVYRVAGVPPTWEQGLLAAVLAAGPGAVASHRSAARLWSLHEDDALDVSVRGRCGRRLRGATLHMSSDLCVASAIRRHGIPTTTPMRALVDLGAVVTIADLEDALDRALERRLLTIDGVERALEQVARRGRTGAGALRAVLDGRALGRDRPDSLLEPRMARLLRRYGLPPAVFKHEVRHGGRLVARIDFAYPDRRIAIEVDGFTSHSTPRALQADHDRQNALVALGWTVVRFTWSDVVRRPAKVAEVLRSLLA